MENTTRSVWVDISDICHKIDKNYHTYGAQGRADLQRRVYSHLKFGGRAHVVGQRSIPYYDFIAKQEISTRIDVPLWSIGAIQSSEIGLIPLFGPPDAFFHAEDVPLRAELLLSSVWLPLLTNPVLMQYLPLGELLSAIPPNQPAGAWARVMGVILARKWRMKPQESSAGTFTVSRRELLMHYIPRTGPVQDVLTGNVPGRAIDFWSQALVYLVECGYLSAKGEAAEGIAKQKLNSEGQPITRRKGWQNEWLNAEVCLLPGDKMKPSVNNLAGKQPAKPRPKLLTGEKRGRGRPTKSESQ